MAAGERMAGTALGLTVLAVVILAMPVVSAGGVQFYASPSYVPYGAHSYVKERVLNSSGGGYNANLHHAPSFILTNGTDFQSSESLANLSGGTYSYRVESGVRDIKFSCASSTCASGKHAFLVNWSYTYAAQLFTNCSNPYSRTIVFASVTLEIVAQVIASGGGILASATHKVYAQQLTANGSVNTGPKGPFQYVFGGRANLVSGQSYSIRTYWIGTTFAYSFAVSTLCGTYAAVDTGRAGTTGLNSVEVA
jgi:hypothetical protein